jgi:hypothetical protein
VTDYGREAAPGCLSTGLRPHTRETQAKDGELVVQDKLAVLFHPRRSSKVSGMEASKQLSRRAIEEFKEIYLDEFGKTLSDDEAQQMALGLLRLFNILI